MVETAPASIPQPAREGTLELSDGRTLGYAEYGSPDGDPLFFFHGTPGSRYTRIPDTSILDEHGVRQVTLERPGFGRSTYDGDRTLLDWPTDVTEAADLLGIEEFAIVGFSGGGPHTLACARQIPERLTSVGIVSAMGPLDAPGVTDGMEFKTRLGFALAKVPILLRPFIWFRSRKIRSDPEGFIDAWSTSAAEPDQEILARDDVRAVIAQNYPEAVRQGTRGPLHENRLFARSWGFDLSDISVPVDAWYGALDAFTPEAMARHVVEEIPDCNDRFYPDEGHLLAYSRWDEILPTLVGG